MIVKINGQQVPHLFDYPQPMKAFDAPKWYDLAGQFDLMMQHVEQYVADLWQTACDAFITGLDILFPTLALIGIILYMVPFFPYSEKGPKITGTSLLLYMFYILIKGAV